MSKPRRTLPVEASGKPLDSCTVVCLGSSFCLALILGGVNTSEGAESPAFDEALDEVCCVLDALRRQLKVSAVCEQVRVGGV